MKFETVYICDHCGTRSGPVSSKDDDYSSPLTASASLPPGWASVLVQLDVASPKTPEEKASEELKRKTKSAALELVKRLNLPIGDPQRDLIEAQIKASEVYEPERMPFNASMALCSSCQVGPVFEVAQAELEQASGVSLPMVGLHDFVRKP